MTRIVHAGLIVVALVIVLRAAPATAQPSTPTGAVAETARSLVFKWDRVTGATWYYLWVHDATGLVFQQWYTNTEANCHPGYLEDCRVGVPLSAVPSGNITWWVRAWSPDGYSPWTATQTVGHPGPFLAVINADGTTARGNHLSATRLGPGIYDIVFGRDLTACVLSATVQNAIAGITAVGNPAGNNPTLVRVGTFDMSGTFIDNPVHLMVSCL